MAVESRLAITTALFVFAIGFGVWVSRTGRPLNTLIFTFHKLIALAAIILSVVTLYQIFTAADLTSAQMAAVIACGLLLLVTFGLGAWLSIVKTAQPALATGHLVTSVLAAVAAASTIYLLSGHV